MPESTDDLTKGEIEVRIDGLSDDVSFVWVLIDLGLRDNPPDRDQPPDDHMIRDAFVSLHCPSRPTLDYIADFSQAPRVDPSASVTQAIDTLERWPPDLWVELVVQVS